MGPAGLPPALVSRLNADVNAVITSTEISERLSIDGTEPTAVTPEAAGKYLATEIARWRAVAQKAGVKLD
jgi:tripartite-type tricarboxylate transporter receptor subunit TctC